MGDHEDPRKAGERPDLKGKVTVPDILIQAHSAAVQITFYDASSGSSGFPPDYTGAAFIAQHGFLADYRPSYDPADAPVAWAKCLAFLKANGVA